MSRKHYIALAQIIKNRIETAATPDAVAATVGLASDIMDMCADDNARFDYNTFRRACGLPVLIGN